MTETYYEVSSKQEFLDLIDVFIADSKAQGWWSYSPADYQQVTVRWNGGGTNTRYTITLAVDTLDRLKRRLKRQQYQKKRSVPVLEKHYA